MQTAVETASTQTMSMPSGLKTRRRLETAQSSTAQFSNSYTMLPLALIYPKFARSQLLSNQYQLLWFLVLESSEFHQRHRFRHIPLLIISDWELVFRCYKQNRN